MNESTWFNQVQKNLTKVERNMNMVLLGMIIVLLLSFDVFSELIVYLVGSIM